MIITRKSPFTHKVHVKDLPVTDGQMLMYARGVCVQDAFPQLSPGDREFIKTGITEEEWDEVFFPKKAKATT